MNEAMLALLQQRATVHVFDRASRSGSRLQGLCQQLLLICKFIGTCLGKRRLTLYLPLSGGNGQLLDLPYILVSRICRQRIFIHHHSFAYVNSSTLINKVLFSLLKDQSHITLSRGMATALTRRYQLNEQKVVALSNAAFFSAARANKPHASDNGTTPIRLGFLSNIIFDKGIGEFFAVLTRLRELKVPYRAYIAGPVASDAKQEFERLLAAAADVEYVGAVYGASKDDFFGKLDVLLFPTKYANEAEPLVIHEALQSGVYVIACNRGAIAEMLENGAGLVAMLEGFVDAAAERLRVLNDDRAKLLEAQAMAVEQSQRLRTAASAVLEKVLTEISPQ
ncbi:MAG: glycosyltransferase family 4 protein [Steroidobacteraceae bacterium]